MLLAQGLATGMAASNLGDHAATNVTVVTPRQGMFRRPDAAVPRPSPTHGAATLASPWEERCLELSRSGGTSRLQAVCPNGLLLLEPTKDDLFRTLHGAAV